MGKKEKTTSPAHKVRISTEAFLNMEEITGRIAFFNHQPLAAIEVGDAFFATFDRIAEHPRAFRECDGLVTKSKMYRRANCLSWNIIYRITGDEVVILGVIHMSRKPSATRNLRNVK